MAYIRYPGPISFSEDSLNIYNWKTLKKNQDGVLVGVDFQVYQIKECDINEIHEANLKHKRYALEKRFRYVQNELSCTVCGGRGILDWIQNVTKPPVSPFGPDPYKRKPEGKIYLITTNKNQEIFLSSQHIPTGFEECKKCFGSGLHRIGYNMKSKDEVETGILKPDKK